MELSHIICSFSVFFLLITFNIPLVYGNAELKALMQLKSSLDPTNKLLQSWRSDEDPCSGSFEGVACNEHRKVANISLQSKGLNGTVSAAVAELKSLSGLYLHYNSLTGQIPKEIGGLTELSDLYLDVNNLSGSIPLEIGNMTSLQVLQLCCNQLTGDIPTQFGSLKKLSVLALQYNKLNGVIPSSLADLGMLRRLDLSFNSFSSIIPASLADILQLQVLDVRNNSLIGVVPSGLKKLGEGFQSENNPGLCGVGFPKVRACTSFDNVNINQIDPMGPTTTNDTFNKVLPEPDHLQPNCSHTHCSNSKLPKIAVILGVSVVTIVLVGAILLTIFRYRRQKQKIGNASETSDMQLSIDQAEELSRKGNNASPLVNLEYSNRWNNPAGFSDEFLNGFKFNLKEIESATQYFSQVNLLGKNSFSSVYKGILRDGSVVAIRSINIASCKTEEAEFVKGLNFLTSLRHENLVKLKGFCCSKSRNECYLIYDFCPRGALSKYLDSDDKVLDWSSRVFIINGIAKGIRYLHSSDANKQVIIHRNISVEKIFIDRDFNPLIADSGLHKVLADDFVFSALKISAAMGYMAPEYVTTGRFTEKTDIFAFGVIILQIISGKCMITNSTRLAAETGRPGDLIDSNLVGEYSESEAIKLGKLGVGCTKEKPGDRPTMEEVIQELINLV